MLHYNGQLYASTSSSSGHFLIFKTIIRQLYVLVHGGTTEGNVNIAGTTVTFNGADVGRWSQLLNGYKP